MYTKYFTSFVAARVFLPVLNVIVMEPGFSANWPTKAGCRRTLGSV